jgi:formylglycine-generating enzyme required for sulfatase activity
MSAAKPEFVAFFSYSSADRDFALDLARDLREKGAVIWMDQLDIIPGERWDTAVELAIRRCAGMLVILSPDSVGSTNVMDEVSFALEEHKVVIPVLHRDCDIPFRLRRVHRVDVRTDYDRGLRELLGVLKAPRLSPPEVKEDAPPAAATPIAGPVQPRPEPSNPSAVSGMASAQTRPADKPQTSTALPQQENPTPPVAGAGKPKADATHSKTWWSWTGSYLASITSTSAGKLAAAFVLVLAVSVGYWRFAQPSPTATEHSSTSMASKGIPADNAAPSATSPKEHSPTETLLSPSQPPAPATKSSAPPNVKTGSYINPKDNLTYIWIPPGKFGMGCSPDDVECSPDEKPQQKDVQIPGFWLGKTDVTQAAWNKVGIAANPSHFKGDDLPVDSVDWNEANSYCKAIGGRLPTEKEWEYAARAGTTGPRYGTIDDIAWYSVNSGQTTHPVGKKQANAFKLYDMLGNVYQWTATDWGPYPGGTADDCKGCKVLRGGSWFDYAGVVRASNRERSVPTSRDSDSGFRCVGEFR